MILAISPVEADTLKLLRCQEDSALDLLAYLDTIDPGYTRQKRQIFEQLMRIKLKILKVEMVPVGLLCARN